MTFTSGCLRIRVSGPYPRKGKTPCYHCKITRKGEYPSWRGVVHAAPQWSPFAAAEAKARAALLAMGIAFERDGFETDGCATDAFGPCVAWPSGYHPGLPM